MWELSTELTPETLASEVRTIVKAELPVQIYEIIRILDIELELYELPDSISGVYSEVYGQPVIGINSKHSPARRRFTIAHELYHYCTELDGEISAMSATATGMDEIERNANKFAAILLIPEDSARRLWETGLCLKHMAEVFDVSEQAMGIRLKDLGLSRRRHRSHGNHVAEDCCILAGIQRIARGPFIEGLIPNWLEAGAVAEGQDQPYLPMFSEGKFLARTGIGGEANGYQAQRTELLAHIDLHRQEG